MRRLAAIALILVLGTALVASAAYLDVDGGVLQTFHFDVDLDVPDEADCNQEEAACQPETERPQSRATQQPSTTSPPTTIADEQDQTSSTTVADTKSSTTSMPPETTVTTEPDRIISPPTTGPSLGS